MRYRAPVPTAPPRQISRRRTGRGSVERGTPRGPRVRRFEGRRGGEDSALGEAAPDDLQPHRQSRRREAYGHRGRGLPGEIEGEAERDPAEGGDGLAVDLLDGGARDGKRRHRHRGRDQEIEAREEALHLGPELVPPARGGQVLIDGDRPAMLE